VARQGGRVNDSQSMPAAVDAPLITIARTDVGRRTVLAVAGEVDIASAPDLGSALDAAVEAGAHDLWIDLTATTFIDSTCLHVLIEANRLARELHHRFAVVCPPGTVRRVFDVAGVAEALPLYDDVSSAHRDS
jgi:anti-sigma B factor antagonist